MALASALGGVLVNLAGRYNAPAADVEQALMFAARRPLASGAETATEEIAGRIRGLLQESAEKERRRAGHLERYTAGGAYPTAAPPPFDERPDIESALERLDRPTRTALLGALALGCDHNELAALLSTSRRPLSPATARKRLERAKVAAREEIQRGREKSRHTPRRKPS